MNDVIAFSRAANNGDLRTLKSMVKEGYEVHKDSGLCFINAIKAGHLTVVKFLLEHKIPYSVRNAFREASLNGQTAVLKHLFKAVGPLNEKHVKDILMTACCNGYLDIVKFLEKKVDLRTEDDRALYLASYFNKMIIVQYLLSKGLKLESRNHRAFKGSLRSPQDEISQFIIQKYDDIKTINKFLTFSAKAGKLDNVKLLIAKGGDIKIARKFGNQPILDHCTKIFFKDLQEAIPYKAEKEKLIKI
jgi:ankyrin repeat protein